MQMFKIRGADGKEYGPVGADTLRQWIAQRRVVATTLVQAEGSAEWKPLRFVRSAARKRRYPSDPLRVGRSTVASVSSSGAPRLLLPNRTRHTPLASQFEYVTGIPCGGTAGHLIP